MNPCVHSSTIHNSQGMEEPKCPLTYEWIKKIWCVYIYIYMNITQELNNATTLMQLEIIIVSKVSQKGKNPIC